MSPGGILESPDIASWLAQADRFGPGIARRVACMVSLGEQGVVRNESARETLVSVANRLHGVDRALTCFPGDLLLVPRSVRAAMSNAPSLGEKAHLPAGPRPLKLFGRAQEAQDDSGSGPGARMVGRSIQPRSGVLRDSEASGHRGKFGRRWGLRHHFEG